MPEKADTVRVIGYRYQRTLATEATIEGVGFVTGVRVCVRLKPAPANTGLVFRRTDLPKLPTVPALVPFVTGTQRRTTLGAVAHGVTLVEHLLASLAGSRIDNCQIELDGPEPPGLDGSAAEYVAHIQDAGAVLQATRRPVWGTPTPIIVSAGGATIGLHPSPEPGLRVSYLLDYGVFAPIPRQTFTLEVQPEQFATEVARCRTFVTESEAVVLRAQGIGRHLTATDLLVFGPRGPIDTQLRFPDEPVRHKVLDIIGDLSLCGFDLAGHIVAYRSGHALNVELARVLTTLAAKATSHQITQRSRPTLKRAA